MDPTRQLARRLRNDMTEAERHLWRALRLRQIDGFRFRRQVPIGKFIVDFLCPRAKLVIELDGSHHADAKAYDQARSEWLHGQGYRVRRFWNHEALNNTETVLAAIQSELAENLTPPQPSPALRAREGVNKERA